MVNNDLYSSPPSSCGIFNLYPDRCLISPRSSELLEAGHWAAVKSWCWRSSFHNAVTGRTAGCWWAAGSTVMTRPWCWRSFTTRSSPGRSNSTFSRSVELWTTLIFYTWTSVSKSKKDDNNTSTIFSQMQAQSGVELSVLGSWSLPKEGQEGMESFLRDLSTIFPQRRWLQISREIGKMGFTCNVVNRDQSKSVIIDIHWVSEVV